MPFDVDVFVLLVGFGALFLGALVKGMLGLGLPLIAVPLLTLVVDAQVAIAALMLPIVASNLWQALVGGQILVNLRRFWPLIVVMVPMIVVGASLLTSLDTPTLDLILGIAMIVISVINLTRLRFSIPPHWEQRAGVITGFITGILTGMTSFYGPPLVLYTQAIGLKKEVFVPAIGALYLIGGLTLTFSLGGYGVLDGPVLLASALGIIPTFIAMALGQRLSRRISQDAFRKAIFILLLIIGASLITRSFSG